MTGIEEQRFLAIYRFFSRPDGKTTYNHKIKVQHATGKTDYQKTLKIISIILIIFSIIGALTSIALLVITLMAASFVEQSTSEVDFMSSYGAMFSDMGLNSFTDIAQYLWAIGLISSIFMLIVGIFGIRGANNPNKILPFRNLAIFLFVFEALGLIMNIISMVTSGMPVTISNVMSTVVSSLISIVLAGICVWLAIQIQKQAIEMEQHPVNQIPQR